MAIELSGSAPLFEVYDMPTAFAFYCLHVKRLSDVHLGVVSRLVPDSVKRAKNRQG